MLSVKCFYEFVQVEDEESTLINISKEKENSKENSTEERRGDVDRENFPLEKTRVAQFDHDDHGATNESPKEDVASCELDREQAMIIFKLNADPALWVRDDETRDFAAINGVKQNMDMDFSSSKNIYSDRVTRYLPTDLFKRRLKNGEVQPRSWLLFSESKGAVFCIPCLLLGHKTNSFTMDGFRDWKNARSGVEGHDNSNTHKTNVSCLKSRGNAASRLNNALIHQLDEEISYWRNVLRRVIAVAQSLAERGLPFRGHTEKLGNPHSGNFQATMELIAQFGPFLAQHLQQYAHLGSGSTSYLSKTVYEEFLLLLRDKLLDVVLSEVKTAKYFGISVDSTPDIARVDQLTFILRYFLKAGSQLNDLSASKQIQGTRLKS